MALRLIFVVFEIFDLIFVFKPVVCREVHVLKLYLLLIAHSTPGRATLAPLAKGRDPQAGRPLCPLHSPFT
jgi:hypothetical protein